MAVIVRGATCSLGEAVVDKLLSMGVNVVAKEETHLKRNTTLLQYSEAKILQEGEGFSVSFDGSDADIVIGSDIIVHDLIPTRKDKWIPQEFLFWSKGKEYTSPSRYWVSVTDAAYAIANLIKAEKTCTELHLCGRREWSAEDTKAEFDMLWERTSQGKTGKFTAETLFGHEIAGMVPKPIHNEDGQRPDLAPLHETLLQITGEGWRPLIPLRTAIMTLIAGLVE